jgi:hypothetical protein
VVKKEGPRCSQDFNWDNLHLSTCDLYILDEIFSKEEVHDAIKDLPFDKALDPDGFSGLFFKSCWDIIKDDIMNLIT